MPGKRLGKWREYPLRGYTHWYMAPSSSSPFSSSSSSPGGQSGTFHSYPEKFPQTRRKAATFLQQIHAVTKKGPRTLVGTIVDTSYFHAQGYVTATTELGVVSVYGVPYGSVVPQMRIFCRQMGGHATNRGYVFDGMAPNLSALGMSSGSFAFTTTTSGVTATPTVSGTLTSPALAGSTGYYWHCFFYIPVLPTSTVVLWQFTDVAGTNTVVLDYLPSGLLRMRCTQDGHGYQSSQVVPPHSMHWLVVQPGLGASSLMIDGVASYSGSDTLTFTGSSHTYLIDLLSDHAGTSPSPLGTWVSKVGWGTSVSGATPIALSSSLPQSDNDLPASVGTTTQKLFLLCGDSVGSSTLTNSAPGSPGSLSINTTYATILATGPY